MHTYEEWHIGYDCFMLLMWKNKKNVIYGWFEYFCNAFKIAMFAELNKIQNKFVLQFLFFWRGPIRFIDQHLHKQK